MAQVSFWKALGLIGQLVSDLNEAYEDDQKIDFKEIINIGQDIVKKIDIPQKENTDKYLIIADKLFDWFEEASEDKKISASEGIQLLRIFADIFDYELDEEGIDLSHLPGI